MAELPRWFTEPIPATHEYSMAMFENGGSIEQIEMSRAEYIALADHLAALRGYSVGSIRKRLAGLCSALPREYSAGDDMQQSACHLETARAIYKSCPELVVVPSKKLDRMVAKLAE